MVTYRPWFPIKAEKEDNPKNCRPGRSNGAFLLLAEAPGGGTPYNGLYGEAPPERGTFFRLQVYKRLGISRAEVFEGVGKSVI